MLRLAVRVRPLVSAVATFRVMGDAQRCMVTLEEGPARRFIGNLARPLLDPATHVRNHRSLKRLAELVAGRDLEPQLGQNGRASGFAFVGSYLKRSSAGGRTMSAARPTPNHDGSRPRTTAAG